MAVSTGTILAAALESSGYKAQSLILEHFGGMLHDLGALLVVASAIGGLVVVALMGNYRSGLWFFVGPALFFFVLRNPVPATGVEWQFGEFKPNQEQIDAVLQESVNAKVSWLFHSYNWLVSGVVQESIKIITNNSMRAQMRFMSRQRMMDSLFNAELDNPGLLALIHRGIKGDCYKEMNAARIIALGNRENKEYRGTAEYMDALTVYADPKKRARFSLDQNTVEYNYLVDLFRSVQQLPVERTYTLNCEGPEDSTVDYDTWSPDASLQAPVMCAQIWCWMQIGVASEAGRLQREAEEKYINQYAKDAYPDIYAEMWHHIAVKLQPPQIKFEADFDIEPQAPSDASLIPVIIGGILLRKELVKDPRSEMYSSLGDHAGVYTKPYNFNFQMTKEQVQDVTQRMNKHTMAESQKYETYVLALVLPYIQGILLYGLSILFPFFALLILIPGRAGAFFTWMALWAWAKCWDIGWAAVMVVDEILWELMPHSSIVNYEKDLNHGPITIFEAAFQSDPAYSMSQYYMLLGVLIISVPMLTANMILGSKRAVGGILIDGLKSMSQKLGGSAADWIGHNQCGKIDFFREAFAIDYVQRHKGQAANKGIADAWAKFDAREQQAGWGKKAAIGVGIAGAVIAGILCWPALVAGAAVVGIGGGTALGTGAVVGMAGTGAAVAGGSYKWSSDTYRASKDTVRETNSKRAAWQTVNNFVHYYNATQMAGFRNMDSIRSGLANRGEFWNVIDAPIDVVKNLELIKTDLDAQSAEALGTVFGSSVRVATDIATRRRSK